VILFSHVHCVLDHVNTVFRRYRHLFKSRLTMEGVVQENGGAKKHSCKFLSLPTETLVLIFSFLRFTRDKVKIRYISQRLRSAVETPSLWRTFLWPYYDDREELSINSLLKVCGKYVRKMAFPDHVPSSKLVEMLKYCSIVTHLSLPKGTVFSETQLREALEHVTQLEYLIIHWWLAIKPLLLIAANCKELTVYASVNRPVLLSHWLQEWMENGFMPRNLNIVCDCISIYDVIQLTDDWSECNEQYSFNHTATLRFYTSLNVPIKLIPPIPVYQLQYGPMAVLPFTSASKFGILGLRKDLVLLTSSCHGDDNVAYKAWTMSGTEFQLDMLHCKFDSISFLTDFEVTHSRELHSGHLEQIAIACPNLQQLNLLRSENCLKNLQGLHSIARSCKKLQGLNLLGISVSNVENQLQVWEILSDMHLTHLAIDLCMLKLDDAVKERVGCLFLHSSVLQALEMHNNSLSCSECGKFVSEDLVQLSHFPKLSYCKLTRFPFQCTIVHDIVTRCKTLSTLNIHCSFYQSLPPTLTSLSQNCTLKKLCLSSHCAVVSDEFMEAVSAHGGLEHTIFLVQQITYGGIIAVVSNSPLLVTFRAAVSRAVKQDGIPNLMNLKAALTEMFPHRKAFTMGSYLVKENGDHRYLSCDFLSGTDFKLPLWPINHLHL